MRLAPGFATDEGTAAFARRSIASGHSVAGHFRRTAGGLTVSSLGLGTYLGRPDGPTDRAVEEAVRICLRSGRVNVIDTAINYRSQRAERSVGRALGGLFEAGLPRQEVFVATKVGYLAPDGESARSPAEWVDRELIAPGRLDPADIVGGSHAMSPSYLRDQVGRSRDNLGLETLDLVYLHNAVEAQKSVVGRAEFGRRVARAFGELEDLRASGWLRAYGLATWDALRSEPGLPGYQSVEELVELARTAGGDHHGFRFLQFPYNLSMPEASSYTNQRVRGSGRTLFAASAELGVGCFTSVPLLQGRLARPGGESGALTAAQSALQFARSAAGNLAALVGQKSPAHLSENLALAGVPPDRADGGSSTDNAPARGSA